MPFPLPRAAEDVGDLTAGFCTPGSQAMETPTRLVHGTTYFSGRSLIRPTSVWRSPADLTSALYFKNAFPHVLGFFTLSVHLHTVHESE